MAQESGGEKTLPASQQKLDRAREEGNIARSQDLSSAAALAAALLALLMLGKDIFRTLIDAGEYFFGQADILTVQFQSIQQLQSQALYYVALGAMPFMIAMVAAGIAMNLLQVGFMATSKPLTPKFDRIDPIKGLQRLFSLRSLVELIKSLAKLILIGTVVWMYLRDQLPTLISLMHLDPLSLLPPVGVLVVGVWWRVVVVMLLIGLSDYAYQRWQHGQDLRMTQQEARQEAKELEGDPHIKRRVRQLQRQMATQRMMKDVPEADVVITNPTHYAIALRYDPENMQAPTVVAKGMRLVAQRIREIAEENNVPIVQKPPLARELFRTVDIGGVVPEALFTVVAEVLSYVYRIDRRTAKQQERARLMGASAA
ncbi:MAG: flagellar biosynthesis protein FlhB [Candidatus Hydrogenedens sp.]|nr:flagellar biosynthesis protein FlhB [Candidatus Hydrogenedens sp.]